MRDLGSKDNVATIKDGISGTEIELTYRTPTTTELQNYYSGSLIRKGGKSISNVVASRVQFALKIITGFNDGVFSKDGKPISSNVSSPDYYADWKQLIGDKAPDLLDSFIQVTFDNTRMKIFAQDDMEADSEVPLECSSNGSGSDAQAS